MSISVNSPQLNEVDITAYYRPPHQLNEVFFFSHLTKCIDSNRTPFHIIIGDLNVDILKFSSVKPNCISNKFINLIESAGYSVYNKGITRPLSKSILDVLVVRCSFNISVLNSCIENPLSDHNAISSIVSIPNISKYVTSTTSFTDFRQINKKLSSIYSNLPPFSCPNLFCDHIVKTLQDSYNEFTTNKTKKIKRTFELCPWMNQHLLSVIKQKNNLYKKYKKNKFNVSLGQKLDVLNRNVKKLQNLYKYEYFSNLFTSSNTQHTWRNINKILGKSPKRQNVDELVDRDQYIISDNFEIANSFNKFFVNVAHDLSSQIVSCSSDDINKFDSLATCNDSIFLSPTDDSEVCQIICSLDSAKSAGCDNIQVILLKKCSKYIVPVLTKLFNLCISSGQYPNCLKTAKVTPIYKSGLKNCVSNYRPISVLSNLNKIFEKILHVRLTNFLTGTHYFYSHQYGFRKQCGTHTACTELLNKILMDIDSKNIVSGLFLDLSKAFDCVNHDILLTKMYISGIRGLPLQLFRNYLMNRKQFVIVNNVNSNILDIDIGVPQGSVLGPLLFLMYINDVYKLPLGNQIFLFADDSALFASNPLVSTNVLSLESDASILLEYFRINKLSLNLKKSNLVHFRSRYVKQFSSTSVMLSSIEIKPVPVVKYLGLLMDEFLSWKPHIAQLCTKISQKIGVMRKLQYFLPIKILKILYFSFVHSNINYLIGIWGTAKNSIMKSISTLQRRAIKCIFKLPYRFPTFKLLQIPDNNILLPSNMFKINVCKYVFASVQNKAYHTTNFHGLTHTFNTRFRNTLTKPFVKTNYGSCSISAVGPTLYNDVPEIIKTSNTLTQFGTRIKQYYLEQQRNIYVNR